MGSFEGLGLALDRPEDEQLRNQADMQSEVDVGVLVTTYLPLLFRVANSILRNSHESEDVVQDVFLRVVERQASLAEIRDMRVWLVRIAWNLALSRRRGTRAEQMDDLFAQGLVGSDVPADKAFEEAQRMRAVLHEMERLPKAEHHVLLLSAVEELEMPEIAAVLDRSESAVRGLLFRARTRLRERLEKRGGKR